ncbi:hypothetical protein PCANC_06086 [Puccinia coronata f. sp. avenae]|uniref:Uncharacterized protein n=1 Tax=Puccinia coronata f. sp. avenae TaxID=200324 RepID=A0A2N5VTS2_9BASI|nr:hypothetical protein PCANC_06086 [Puccinia coronata f. sp. avenae]
MIHTYLLLEPVCCDIYVRCSLKRGRVVRSYKRLPKGTPQCILVLLAAIRQAVHQSSKAILLGHSSLSQLGNSLFSPVPPVGTSPPTSRIVNVSRFLEFLGKQQRLTARPNQHRQSYSFRHRPVPTHHHPPAPYQSSLALQLI